MKCYTTRLEIEAMFVAEDGLEDDELREQAVIAIEGECKELFLFLDITEAEDPGFWKSRNLAEGYDEDSIVWGKKDIKARDALKLNKNKGKKSGT